MRTREEPGETGYLRGFRGAGDSWLDSPTRHAKRILFWADVARWWPAMSVWELEGYDTDRREARWRQYTQNPHTADLWVRIPKIQFSDSGHGIVFTATVHSGRRKPTTRSPDYVQYWMRRMGGLKRKRPPDDLTLADIAQEMRACHEVRIDANLIRDLSRGWYASLEKLGVPSQDVVRPDGGQR